MTRDTVETAVRQDRSKTVSQTVVAHRIDIVRRLLELGVGRDALEVLLPGWDATIEQAQRGDRP